VAVIHLEIEGRVQGVGFRWFVRERASALGIAGWVRNTDSGDVEVAARGEDESVASLVADIGRGPAGALVRSVRHLAPDPATEYPNPFRIVP
jgi:acylphosphatase